MAAADANEPGLGRSRLAVLLLAALTTVPLLGTHDLWHSDEPRYAQVGREVARDGDWIVMHLNRERYTEKPPLYFWCEALLAQASGDVGPFEARLPSAVSGAIGALLCFELGRRLFGRRVAFAGALILVTTQQWTWISHRCALDVMLAAFVAGAMLCEEIGRERGSTGWRIAAFAVAGGGFLVKGPPLLVFFLLAHVARAWAARDWRSLARVPWLRGLLAFAAVVALWGVPWAMRLGLDEVERILSRQTAGRMTASYAHAEGPLYFLRTLPAGFLPWTIAWAAAAWLAWKRRAGPPAASPLPVGFRWLLAFSAAALVVFSCISGKRSIYLQPIFPALALVTACALDRVAPAGRDLLRITNRIAVAIAVLATAVGFLWLPIADRGFEHGAFRVQGQSPRALGELARRELDAGRVVAAMNLRHDESVLYYSGSDRLEVLHFATASDGGGRGDAARLRELAVTHGERLSVITDEDEGAMLLAVLPRGADAVERIVVDGRPYSLWRCR